MSKISKQQLKSYLWESANILRGKIDSGDFKHYILGLLFFKRLSDVFDVLNNPLYLFDIRGLLFLE